MAPRRRATRGKRNSTAAGRTPRKTRAAKQELDGQPASEAGSPADLGPDEADSSDEGDDEGEPESVPVPEAEAELEAETEAVADDNDDEQVEEEEEEEDEEEEAEEEEAPEDDAEVVVDEDGEENGPVAAALKSPSPPPEPILRKKRLGRPPKIRPPDWQQSDRDSTPRRGRGRGGWRGRGGRKGAQVAVTQIPLDKDGNPMEVANDEVVLPEDPEGEKKVDSLGNLLGGRDYRCRTFTVLGRGDRLYMLSTEPARCVGFRDSYLFFTKHKHLFKIIVSDSEKRDLIDRKIIPHSYKGRSIGVVTARSVFREFGALIVIGGRRITDDYEVARARAEGAVEGELADPMDRFVDSETYNKNQYVAWHGASSVYHQSGPPGQIQQTRPDMIKKRKIGINDSNWMLEHAKEASNFNLQLSNMRSISQQGIYDIHTNLMLRPAVMQPTYARAEVVTDTRAPFPTVSPSATLDSAGVPVGATMFPPLPPRIGTRYYVTDTYMETPQGGLSTAAYDTIYSQQKQQPFRGLAGGADLIAPFQGLGAVAPEIRDLLPPECCAAFDAARDHELNFMAKRLAIALDDNVACRRPPVIDKGLVPYSTW